jgi:hypothetical protein
VAKENLQDGKPHTAFVFVVTPGYLETMGIRFVAGRDISWRDRAGAPRAIVIDEAAARREWPGRDPLGQPVFGLGRERAVLSVWSKMCARVVSRSRPALMRM